MITKLFVETVKPRDRAGSGLSSGQYITRSAHNLKLMTPEVRSSLTFVSYLDYIDRGLLVGMNLLVRGEEKGEYMWNQTPIRSNFSEAFVTPESKGAGYSGSSRKKRKVDFDGDDMVDALEEVSGRILEFAIEGKNNYNRLSFQLHNLQKEVAWQTSAMEEFFLHMGFTPSVRFAPGPSWPPSSRAPTGYASWEDCIQRNEP